jgi:hypothetical protein
VKARGRHVRGRRPAERPTQIRYGRPKVVLRDGAWRLRQSAVDSDGRQWLHESGARETATAAIRLGWFWVLFGTEERR